jgi:hypothetical protein
MNHLFRRDGTPYPDGQAGMEEWGRDFNVPAKRTVREDTLPNNLCVRTFWRGFDYSPRRGVPPMIFETLVFNPSRLEEVHYCELYASEAEASAGHQRIVDNYTA